MKTVPFYVVPVLWLISFFFSVPLVEPYEISRLVALGAAVAALGVVLADPANRLASINITPLSVLVTLFLVWCGATFFWSVSPFVTVITFGTLCLLPLWFLIFALLPMTSAQVMLTLRLAVVALALLALWAVAQYFVFTSFLTSYGTIRYPFADPNNYAAILNMGLFAALGLSFATDHKSQRVYSGVAAALMMAAIVLIGSRVAMAVSVVGLLGFGLLARRNAGFDFKVIGFVVLAGIIALAATTLFSAERITSVMRVAELVQPAQDASLSARFMIWSSSWGLLKQHWLAGAGLGSFFLLYPAVRDAAEIYSSGLMAHADPLQFGIEAGLPAVILLYAILVCVLVGFIQFLRSDQPAATRLMVVGLFCALLTLAIHMHASFHLFIAAPLALAGMMMGVLARYLPARTLVTCKLMPWGVIDLLLLAAFLVVLQSCLFSEMHTRQALEALNRQDMPRFGALVNQAGEEGFGMNPRPYVLAATIPMGILHTSRLPVEERGKLFHQADGLLDQGLARSPVSAGAYFSKGLLYASIGRGDEAQQFFEKALKIDPRHEQARAMLDR